MPAHLVGVDQSLISAPRVDNLLSAWAAFTAARSDDLGAGLRGRWLFIHRPFSAELMNC